MGRNRSIILFILTTLFLFVGMTMAESAFVIEIPDKVVVSGSRLSLNELCKVSGGSETDRKILAEIGLGSSPPPGRVRTFSRKYLQLILKRYQFTEIPELRMGAQVTVRMDATLIKDTDIDVVVQKLITVDGLNIVERWAELPSLPKEIWLSKGDWQVRAEQIGETPLIGSTIFRVILSKANKSKVLNISGIIRAKAVVKQVKHDLPCHALITSEDLQPVTLELRTGKEFLGDLPKPGRTTTKISEGEILQKSQIEPSPLVTKGGEVTVLIAGNNFNVKITGTAGADGWLGDKITVRNSISKKSFKGRVVGVDTVEVTVL